MVNLVKKMFMLIALASSAPIHAANISVNVDRNPVQMNESFQIFFQSDTDVDEKPDFSPLKKDFEVISQGQSSNISIVNGSMTRQSRWTVNAMAKRVGDLIIPAIHFGKDQSPPILLRVQENAAATNSTRADLFVEASVDHTSSYVQSQVLYTVRFYRAVNVAGAELSEPKVRDGEIVVEKLGDDAIFETQHQGRRYVVVERKYALFPQQSGDLQIEPLNLTAQVVQGMRSNIDIFGRNVITKRLNSNPVTLHVKPIPERMRGQTWLPASEFKLTENWSSDTDFKVGEPVTRTITLQASGLTGAQLPEITQADVDGIKTYPDQAGVDNLLDNRGITGIRQQKIALIPTRSGTMTLPAVEIPWWNINTNQLEIAKLPARTITIQASSTTVTSPGLQPPKAASTVPLAATATGAESAPWFAIAMALGLGWLLTAAAWLFKSRQPGKVHKPSPIPVNSASLGAFFRACDKNDAPLARATLLQWAQNYWSEQPPRGLDEVAQRLGNSVTSPLQGLNRSLYASDSSPWNGAALKQSVTEAAKSLPKKSRQAGGTPLPPLYPGL